jgi:hypothetical protein
MKIIAAALALTTMLASPAWAASKAKAVTSRRPDVSIQQSRRPQSHNPQWDVYRTDGSYAGSDPDPNVRLNLLRDNPHVDD